MSFKNKLQEYFQKQGLDLPEYTFTNESKEDHNSRWQCVVKIAPVPIVSEFSYKGAVKSSKKKASESAAKIASEALGLEELKAKETTRITILAPSEDTYSTFYLLDIENCPKSYAELCERRVLKPDDAIVAFYSKNTVHIQHKIKEDVAKYGFPVRFYKALSAHKDAADVRMILFVGEMMGMVKGVQTVKSKNYSGCSEEENKIVSNVIHGVEIRFVIFTNDHFGEALADIINTHPCNDSERVSFISEVYHHVSDIP